MFLYVPMFLYSPYPYVLMFLCSYVSMLLYVPMLLFLLDHIPIFLYPYVTMSICPYVLINLCLPM